MSMLPADPAERPIDPQIDSPDTVRIPHETPCDRSPWTVFGDIFAIMLVVGGIYLAFAYYSRPSLAELPTSSNVAATNNR
jgi:hypothetical protein